MVVSRGLDWIAVEVKRYDFLRDGTKEGNIIDQEKNHGRSLAEF